MVKEEEGEDEEEEKKCNDELACWRFVNNNSVIKIVANKQPQDDC